MYKLTIFAFETLTLNIVVMEVLSQNFIKVKSKNYIIETIKF